MTRSSRPAKIFINGRFLTQSVTGVQRYAREVLKAFDRLIGQGEIDRREYTFEVLTPRGLLAPPPLKHIPIRQVGGLRGYLWEQLELPFYAHGGMLFSPGNVHPLLAPLCGPSAVTIHDIGYRMYPKSYTMAFRLAYRILIPAAIRGADAVIAVTETERRNLLACYPSAATRLEAIHSGAPTPIKDYRDPPPSTEKFALWVGTLIDRKNPQGAIDAMVRLNRRITLPLVMVGASYKGIADAGCVIPPGGESAIRLVNRLETFAEIAELYRTAICLLFPSFHEGFGLPALEAMAYGCPLVAADIPALREVCENAALYCDPRDPDDIAAKVQAVAESAMLRNRLRQLGFARVASFSWDQCARETFAVFQRVLCGGAIVRSAAASPADSAIAAS
jgi:glycosyltransferase involved in cell wall biosynthesis